MTTTMATDGIMTNDSVIDAWSHFKQLWVNTMRERRALREHQCRVYLVLLIDGVSIEHPLRSRMDDDTRRIFDSMVNYVTFYMTNVLGGYATQTDHELRWSVEGWDFPEERWWDDIANS